MCTGDPSLRLKNGSGQDDTNVPHCWDHDEENKSERPGTSGPLDSRGGCPYMAAEDFVEDWGLVGLLCCPPEG